MRNVIVTWNGVGGHKNYGNETNAIIGIVLR